MLYCGVFGECEFFEQISFARSSLPLSRATATRSLIGPLTRVIQTGIGLAAELKAASKERKASEAGVEESLTGEHRLPFELMT